MKPTAKVEIMTLTVEKIITGAFCSCRSLKRIWMAPAKRRKLSIAPISTSVKSIEEISVENSWNVCGKILSVKMRPNETNSAMTMIPMVAGSFKKRSLIYEKIAERTIRTENE